MAIPFTELNKLNPSSIIELFELELTVGVHIPTGNPNNLATVFRFHSGANLNSFGEVKFNNNTYQRVAVKIEGFEETSSGVIPRPTMTFSNLGGITRNNEQGVPSVITFSDFLTFINDVTPNNDLLNAKVTRLLPLASSLDNDNFAPIGNNAPVNPFGTPSTDRLEDKVFFIDRKAVENRQVVQFELTNQLDMELKKIPARIVTRDLFPSAGRFV